MQRSPHLPRLLDQLPILGKEDSNLVAPCICHKINSTAHSVTYSTCKQSMHPVSGETKLPRKGYQGQVKGENREKGNKEESKEESKEDAKKQKWEAKDKGILYVQYVYRKHTNFCGHNISWVKFSRGLIFVGKISPP